MSPGRWNRAAPAVWQVAEERSDAHFRARRLDDEIDRTQDSIESLTTEVHTEREQVALLQELLDEREQLLRELHRLTVIEREATAAVRQAERALRVERAKPPPRDDDGHRKRDGRLVRVLADDGAWTALRVEGERNKERLGVYLARLIQVEIADETARTVAPVDRRRRSPGEGSAVPVVHALRVFVTEDVWAQFRAAAVGLRLTLGVYVGQLAEAEAHRLGWRKLDEIVG